RLHHAALSKLRPSNKRRLAAHPVNSSPHRPAVSLVIVPPSWRGQLAPLRPSAGLRVEILALPSRAAHATGAKLERERYEPAHRPFRWRVRKVEWHAWQSPSL